MTASRVAIAVPAIAVPGIAGLDVLHRHVPATVFGEWAATEHSAGSWTVTLVDGGRSLHVGARWAFDRNQAEHIAKRLSEVVPPIKDWQDIPKAVAKLIKKTAADAYAEVAP